MKQRVIVILLVMLSVSLNGYGQFKLDNDYWMCTSMGGDNVYKLKQVEGPTSRGDTCDYLVFDFRKNHLHRSWHFNCQSMADPAPIKYEDEVKYKVYQLFGNEYLLFARDQDITALFEIVRVRRADKIITKDPELILKLIHNSEKSGFEGLPAM